MRGEYFEDAGVMQLTHNLNFLFGCADLVEGGAADGLESPAGLGAGVEDATDHAEPAFPDLVLDLVLPLELLVRDLELSFHRTKTICLLIIILSFRSIIGTPKNHQTHTSSPFFEIGAFNSV